MSAADFFESSSANSKVKTEIVRKYFSGWAAIISTVVPKIAYIDLYSGVGVYSDGTKSTPIQILESAVANPKLHSKLVSIFNDVNPTHADLLKKSISEIPDINKLAHEPTVSNEEVGEQIASRLKQFKLVPTLLFIDPWGYKGLTLRLIHSVLKDWGCDCIFFFNYNRINNAITNPSFVKHVNDLYGEERANKLRGVVKDMDAKEREVLVIDALKESLKEIGGNYVVAFKFYGKKGAKTSHHLILVTKSPKGYNLMKDIMAPLSSKIIDGISFFEFKAEPEAVDQPEPPQANFLEIFEIQEPPPPESPMVAFKNELLVKFKGQTLTMKNIYDQHSLNTNYISRNYKDALLQLESEGLITTNPPASNRRSRMDKLSFADSVVVTFP